MEPDSTVYKPLLQPLLDADGSTYKLVPKSGVVWNSLQETLSPELLPHQKAFQRGDPRLEEPNNTLLLVANLGYHPKKPYRGFASLTNLVIYQLLSAARSHSLFHKYGLIRMLLWVDDEAKTTVLPRTVLRRRKAAVEAELTCGDINEIVTSTSTSGPLLRDHALDLESSFATLQRMKDAGLTTPSHRQGPLEIEASEQGSRNAESKYWLKKDFYKKLDDLEQRFAAGEFAMFTDIPEGQMAAGPMEKSVELSVPSSEWARMMLLSVREEKARREGKSFKGAEELRQLRERVVSGELQRYVASTDTKTIRRNKHRGDLTPEYRELDRLRTRRRAEGNIGSKLEALSREYDAIIAIRKRAATVEGSAAEQLEQEAENRYSAMMKKIASRGFDEKIASMVTYMLNNRSAFHQTPSLLYWDRRRAEPLQAKPEEFFPACEMGLLDFQPQSMWAILREDFPANYDVLEYILSTLLTLPSQSVWQGLNSLAPGAAEWIIPECPSITDPKKGGSAHLDVLTVRCLSLDMFKEILEAWLKWPFRPSRYELLSKMGSDVHDPNEADS
jgi:transcription factor 1